jgi:hypothetical protein
LSKPPEPFTDVVTGIGMHRVNALLATAGVALVLVSAWATVMFVGFRSEKERAQALEAQVAQLQGELEAANQREQALAVQMSSPAPESRASPAVNTPKNAPPAPNDAAPADASAQAREQERWRRRMADPKYRAAWVARQRHDIERRLPDIEEIGLAPDVLDRFLDLLAEQRVRENEAIEAQTGKDARTQQLEIRARAQRDEEERRALLGASDHAKWQEYMETGPARAQLGGLRVELSKTGSPLRAEQFDSLVKPLAEEHKRHQAQRRAHHAASEDTQPAAIQVYMERRFGLIEETIERQRELGRAYLDAEQMELFNRMLDRNLEEARVELREWAAFNKAEMRDPG